MSDTLHVLIAGAGVAGLTAALALARGGHRATIIEKSPVLAEAGAGLQLSPNATAALEQLDLLDRVMRLALAPDGLFVRRWRDGAELMHMQMGPLAELRWKSPSLVIHRADLLKALLDRIALNPAIEVITNAEVLGFAATAKGVQVGAKSGERNIRLDGDFLIGADGLHSAVRGRLGLGETDTPVYSGRTAWRAVLDASLAPPMALYFNTNLWLAPRAHLVHYPLRDGEVVNIVAIVEDNWRGGKTDDFWSETGNKNEIDVRFGSWHEPVRELIGAVTQWRRWPLFDRNPVPRWSDERVVLIGDAAHPVLPFLAQGACMAIEDAAVLARAIERNPGDVTTAISDFEARRMVRSAEIRVASRRQGAVYHMRGPLALARDLTMRNLSQDRIKKRMDWIYDYRVA